MAVPMTQTIDFDASAAALGLSQDASAEYTMDIFHAERQTSASNFAVTVTNIECFKPVVR